MSANGMRAPTTRSAPRLKKSTRQRRLFFCNAAIDSRKMTQWVIFDLYDPSA